jgi:hypothetical protein
MQSESSCSFKSFCLHMEDGVIEELASLYATTFTRMFY